MGLAQLPQHPGYQFRRGGKYLEPDALPGESRDLVDGGGHGGDRNLLDAGGLGEGAIPATALAGHAKGEDTSRRGDRGEAWPVAASEDGDHWLVQGGRQVHGSRVAAEITPRQGGGAGEQVEAVSRL